MMAGGAQPRLPSHGGKLLESSDTTEPLRQGHALCLLPTKTYILASKLSMLTNAKSRQGKDDVAVWLLEVGDEPWQP